MPQEKETAKSASRSKLPNWPTSRPGPEVTEPPPGQKRVATRREQVAEVGYNQETGSPVSKSSVRTQPDISQGSVSPDQEISEQQVKEAEKI